MAPTTHQQVKGVSLCIWTALLALTWVFSPLLLHRYTEQAYAELGHQALHTAAEVQPQLLRAGEEPVMQEVTTTETVFDCPMVGMVDLNDDACAECFAALPLGPQDLAVLLNKLLQGGAETVGLSSALTWQQGAGEMVREMLCHVISAIPHSAVGLRGRTAAQADFTPLMLRDSAIPAENVSGDPTGLPMANKPLPNGLTDTPDSLAMTWAPDWLQDEPLTHKPSAVEDLSFPLLVRWNGETIPTLPFRLALAARGLTPADVRVNLGKSVSYGGMTLPLDEHGRVRLTGAQVMNLPLASVVSGEAVERGLGKHGIVMMEQPAAGEKGTPLRLDRLSRTLSRLAAVPREVKHTHTEPVGGMVFRTPAYLQGWVSAAVGVAMLFLALWLLPLFPAFLRHLLVLLVLPGIVLWQTWALLPQHLWLPLAPAALCWLLFLIALHQLRPIRKGVFGRRVH